MVTTPISRPRIPGATLVGLLIALIVPILPAFFDPIIFGTAETRARIDWGIVMHWINWAALIAVVILAERQPLASIGLRRLRWWTIPLGLLAGLAIMVLSGVLVRALGASSNQQFAVFLQSLPFSTRLVLVVTAGVFEETLFRGYAIERLSAAFGRRWTAGAVTLTLFTLGHIPAVGLAHLFPVFVAGAFVTLLYLWKRDLVVNAIAHATVDGVGLLLVPLVAHHGAS